MDQELEGHKTELFTQFFYLIYHRKTTFILKNKKNSSFLMLIHVFYISFNRTIEEEKGTWSSERKEVQKEFRFLDVREKDQILDSENNQKAVVLLVRHSSSLLQYLFCGRWTLWPTKVVNRISRSVWWWNGHWN